MDLGMEPSALCMLSKCSTIQTHLRTNPKRESASGQGLIHITLRGKDCAQTPAHRLHQSTLLPLFDVSEMPGKYCFKHSSHVWTQHILAVLELQDQCKPKCMYFMFSGPPLWLVGNLEMCCSLYEYLEISQMSSCY